ncbi:hypothetical protein TNCV_3507401 [Trichonephila clavipes]|uniref:Uncharacterized protein n=1 Tax=Trichonephila clavipes TaxID=2585209 RepID=A0A8X6S1Q2_TRICX|nr:hypothetical protein TNCV_3507401 [Trichonephila clavipes]
MTNEDSGLSGLPMELFDMQPQSDYKRWEVPLSGRQQVRITCGISEGGKNGNTKAEVVWQRLGYEENLSVINIFLFFYQSFCRTEL